MLVAWGRDTGCVPRAPRSRTQAPRAQRGARVGPGAEGGSCSPCHSSFTSPPAGNHSTQDPGEEGSGCFVVLPSLRLCSSPPRSREARAVGADCKSSLLQPTSSWLCVLGLWDWPASGCCCCCHWPRGERLVFPLDKLRLVESAQLPMRPIVLNIPICPMRKQRQGDSASGQKPQDSRGFQPVIPKVTLCTLIDNLFLLRPGERPPEGVG